MFNKQEDLSKVSFDSLIGANTEVSGGINSKGFLRIDGRVSGNVTIQGDIFVGENGSIKGDVTASNVHIAGNVEGNIVTSGTLKLLSTSKVVGDIQVKSFLCEEGSVFEGNCKMVDPPASNMTISRKKDLKKAANE